MASRAIIKKLKNFVSLVESCGIKLHKVILFGSYARNQQTEYSDIDVALVADEFIGVSSIDMQLFIKAMRTHYMIQPQTYNTKDFAPDRDPFVEEILRTGIEI